MKKLQIRQAQAVKKLIELDREWNHWYQLAKTVNIEEAREDARRQRARTMKEMNRLEMELGL